MTFAGVLSALLEERGWTPYELGVRAGLPVQTVMNALGERFIPRWQTVRKLCAALGVSPDVFHRGMGPVKAPGGTKPKTMPVPKAGGGEPLEFSRVLDNLLRQREASPKTLAHLTGLTPDNCAKLITTAKDPTFRTIRSVCVALGVSPSYFHERQAPVELPELPLSRRTNGPSPRDLTRPRVQI